MHASPFFYKYFHESQIRDFHPECQNLFSTCVGLIDVGEPILFAMNVKIFLFNMVFYLADHWLMHCKLQLTGCACVVQAALSES